MVNANRTVGVAVVVGVAVAVPVGVLVRVAVAVGVSVGVRVRVAVGVRVGVRVRVTVGVGLGVRMPVDVGVNVGHCVRVAVAVPVGRPVGIEVGVIVTAADRPVASAFSGNGVPFARSAASWLSATSMASASPQPVSSSLATNRRPLPPLTTKAPGAAGRAKEATHPVTVLPARPVAVVGPRLVQSRPAKGLQRWKTPAS